MASQLSNSNEKKGPGFSVVLKKKNKNKNSGFIIWINSGHMAIPEPITVGKEMECPDWSGPSYLLLPLGSRGG